MSYDNTTKPTLTPTSDISAVVLPSNGNLGDVNSGCPYKIYSDSSDSSGLYSDKFLSGAVDQVAYVYKKLGGDILDIELTPGNVYAAYEESVLEYSYIVNIHQATNMLSDALGNTTGSFDDKGVLQSGPLSASLGGSHVSLKYPKFDYALTRRISDGIGSEIGLRGGNIYSGSFSSIAGVQDYDLQTILESVTGSAATGSMSFSGIPSNNDSFTVTNTDGFSKSFFFNTDNTITDGETIGIQGTSAVNSVALKVVSAINASAHLAIIANINTDTASTIDLTQSFGGSSGNTPIIESVTNMTSVNFIGGDDMTPYSDKIRGKKILIKKVYYKTPHAMWRFYGYYGGLNVVGNLHNYGQFSDDSTFQLVPTWQNKSQALAFEDAIYTRLSHFSYEIRNNSNIRLYPVPERHSPTKFWVEFSIPEDVWHNDDPSTEGVNNMNTLPLGNLPFENINSIGKQWIRRYALALCKEMLGQVRSKFGSVPIPNDNISLNGDALLGQAKEEQNALREELKTTLSELTYAKMAETDAGMLESTQKVLEQVPNYIFVG